MNQWGGLPIGVLLTVEGDLVEKLVRGFSILQAGEPLAQARHHIQDSVQLAVLEVCVISMPVERRTSSVVGIFIRRIHGFVVDLSRLQLDPMRCATL